MSIFQMRVPPPFAQHQHGRASWHRLEGTGSGTAKSGTPGAVREMEGLDRTVEVAHQEGVVHRFHRGPVGAIAQRQAQGFLPLLVVAS